MLLIVPWAVPNYITALIWKGMFHRQFGAVNALLALRSASQPVSWFSRFSTAFTANVATNVWLGFPFMMVVTLGALSRIPRELYEAAAVDGATRWQRFRHVTLPLLRPALLPAVLLGAVWTFNMFNVIFLVSGGEPDGATDILVSRPTAGRSRAASATATPPPTRCSSSSCWPRRRLLARGARDGEERRA